MYRNISYSEVTDKATKSRHGQIDLFTWDENGNRIHKVIPHEVSVTYEVPYKTDLLSIFGTYLKRKTFQTKKDRYDWLNKNKDKRVFESDEPEIELLNQLYHDSYDSTDFMKHDLRVHYVDIEIAVEKEFPEPDEAKYPINLITIYDSDDKKYHTWAFTESNCVVPKDKNDKWILHVFKTEKDMLNGYLKWHQNNYPDVLTHWNGRNFDIPYMCNRIKKLLGNNAMKKLSPVGRVTSRKDRNTENILFTIEGITNWDMLFLYKHKYQKKCNGSFSLGNVGNFVLGLPKLELEGSFEDQWKNDFQHYYEYNVRDVEILVKLEEKLELLRLSRSICNMGLSPYEKIYSSIPYIINSIGLYSWNKTGRVFTKYSNHTGDSVDESYEGAYVYPTRPGFYKDYRVVVVDINSLYPNTMIAGNMSPETKVGTFDILPNGNVEVKLSNGNRKTINERQFNNLLDKKCIVTENNTLFFKHEVKEGVVPMFCDELYHNRKEFQKESKRMQLEVVKLKKMHSKISGDNINRFDDKIQELEKQIAVHNLFAYSWKIFLNTIYGLYGTPFSPLYDTDIAQSITRNGQFIIKSIPDYVNNYLKETYGLQNPEEPIFGDTDSIGIDYSCAINDYCKKHNRIPDNFTREDIESICSDLDDFVENKLNVHCGELANERFRTSRGNCIKFAREKFCAEGMFFSKKHYILHVVDSEGVPVDDFIYKGIEIAKNELSPEVKSMLKDIYESICKEKWNEQTFNVKLEEIWNIYSKYGIEKIRKLSGWGKERKSIGFLKCEHNTSAHVRGAIFYNQMIEKLGLTDKNTPLKCGDYVQWVYINPANPYGIDVIAYNKSFPDEFNDLFQVDYKRMFQKNIIKSLEPLCEIMQWTPFDPNNQSLDDIFSF